ncbi:MAG: glycoside hydrolase family 99-like domain-containing protein [Prevotella sp.]|nr:glycoside hydrolase family 99-like domain-containing protein [Prevotella sp.]
MKARLIAYYLPQFHPIPENDKYWGPGFTEWTNVAKAKPQFRGHYQPRIPADLGFYDLRLPETREQQALMAREAGIEGFCYYHYWMGGGRQLLQRPFEEVLKSGHPDFPFCLAWANHEWTTKTWENGGKTQMIAPMLYPGPEDYEAHFNYVLPAFKDKRYITVDGKPIFSIYDPYHFADVATFMQLWRELAERNGLPGIHFTAMISNTTTIRRDSSGKRTRVQPNLESSRVVYDSILALGFDSITSYGKSRGEMIYDGTYKRIAKYLLHKYLPFLPTLKLDYPQIVRHFFAPEDAWENVYPTVIPQWDRTPRAGTSEGVYVNSTPDNFQHHLEDAIKLVENKQPEHRLIFLKSWNEWGEGNYVEPDTKYGHGYLDALRNALKP